MPLPENAAVCRSLQITGCFVPTPRPTPALIYQFTHEDGTALPPIVFVIDESNVPNLVGGTHQEAAKAVSAAARVRRMS